MTKVNFEKQSYKDHEGIWRKCRDVVAGQEVIHNQGEIYLPKLSGQTEEEYCAMVERALFYNATQRTVEAMSGLLFRKDPVVEVPAALEPFLDNIDLNGNSLDVFVEDVADEVLTIARYGLLVDHPSCDHTEEKTQAECLDENLRPFFVKYEGESIINWKVQTIRNVSVTVQVVLREITDQWVDEFETEEVVHYRVLDLDEQGFYRQRLYKEVQEEKFDLIEEFFPLMNNERMKFIPFVFISSKNNTPDIDKPPILDLVNVNISHYKTTADLEHGAHFTALPTAVVVGHSLGEGEKLKIGSTTAWVFSEPDADAKFLEFLGTGLSTLEQRLKVKQDQMATLGARMLATEKAAAETAETHTIKRQGENSALSSVAESIDSGITTALAYMSMWMGAEGDVSYTTNKDYVPVKMSAADMLALFQLLQGGGIPFSDFVHNLQQGEVIDSEKSVDDVSAEIEADQNSLGGLNDDPEE